MPSPSRVAAGVALLGLPAEVMQMILELLGSEDIRSLSLLSQRLHDLCQKPAVWDLSFVGRGDVPIWRVALKLLSRPDLAACVRSISFRHAFDDHNGLGWLLPLPALSYIEKSVSIIQAIIKASIGKHPVMVELRAEWLSSILNNSWQGFLGLIIALSTNVKVIDLELDVYQSVPLVSRIVNSIFSRQQLEPKTDDVNLTTNLHPQQRFDRLKLLNLVDVPNPSLGEILSMRTLRIQSDYRYSPSLPWTFYLKPLVRHAAQSLQALELISVLDIEDTLLECVTKSLLSALKRLVVRDLRLFEVDRYTHRFLIESISTHCPELEYFEFSAKMPDDASRASSRDLARMAKIHTLILDMDLLPRCVPLRLPPRLEHFGLTVSSPEKMFDDNVGLWGPEGLFDKATLFENGLQRQVPMQLFTIDVAVCMPLDPDSIIHFDGQEWQGSCYRLFKYARWARITKGVDLKVNLVFQIEGHSSKMLWIDADGMATAASCGAQAAQTLAILDRAGASNRRRTPTDATQAVG